VDTDFEDPAPEDYVYKPHSIWIEAKANGLSLIQDLNRTGLIVNRFDINKNMGDKVARLRLVSHIIEAGRVWMPARAPHYDRLKGFADDFVECAASFPTGSHNDLVDSMSQAFIVLLRSGLVGNPEDEGIDRPFQYKEKKAFY
jgi:predicted phage terminase large subunit-like protein